MHTLKDVLQKFQSDLQFRQNLKKVKNQDELTAALSSAGIQLSNDDLKKFGNTILGDKLDPKINK